MRSPTSQRSRALTPVEIGRDILLSNVGGHGDNRNVLRVDADHGRGRNTIQVGHDDVHEDEIVPRGILVDLVHGLESILLLGALVWARELGRAMT